MFKQFKEFALKGNVMDMAIGIIIGAAFSTIVKSLVADVIMPPIGLLLGGVDFTDIFIVLKEGATLHAPYETLALAREAGAVTINLGAFANTVISFIIVAVSVFMMVKGLNSMKAAPAPADPTTKDCAFCASTISLKATRCPNCTSELS